MKILFVILLAGHMTCEILVNGQCPSVPECSLCQSGGQAICGDICPGNSSLPKDISLLMTGRGSCTAWLALGLLKAEYVGNFNNLQVLDLSNSHIGSFYTSNSSPSPFAGVPNLKVLLMSHNQIKSLGTAVLRVLTQLKELDVSFNAIVGLIPNAFSSLTELKSLNLANNQIPNLSATCFRGLTNLETLNLSNNKITTVGSDTFATLHRIQTISLDGNNIVDVPAHLFSTLMSLKSIGLSNNNIASLDSGTFTSLVSLQTINLDGNSLKDIPAGLFFNLENLRSVGLSNNKIAAVALDSFSGTSLDKLDLSLNELTSIPRDVVIQTAAKPKTLDLSNNKLTKISSTDLQGIAGETLDLSGNPIDDVEDKAFDGFSISHLDLSNTGLTSIPVSMMTWLIDTSAKVNLGNISVTCSCETLWLARLVDRKTNISPPQCAAGSEQDGMSIKAVLPWLETQCTTATSITSSTSSTPSPSSTSASSTSSITTSLLSTMPTLTSSLTTPPSAVSDSSTPPSRRPHLTKSSSAASTLTKSTTNSEVSEDYNDSNADSDTVTNMFIVVAVISSTALCLAAAGLVLGCYVWKRTNNVIAPLVEDACSSSGYDTHRTHQERRRSKSYQLPTKWSGRRGLMF